MKSLAEWLGFIERQHPKAIALGLDRVSAVLKKLNVELACPSHFIPELPGWRDRSLFIESHGLLTARHYDFYSQALAKIERGHTLDLLDVEQLLLRGLVEPTRLRELFELIEPQLYRYPAVDPPSFRRAVERALSVDPKA